MNDCTFIILGATGDLSKRKLIPAVYRLIMHHKLRNFVVIGTALEAITADTILEQARPFIEGTIDEKAWQILKNSFYYLQMNGKQANDFNLLNELIQKQEQAKKLSGNRLVYLAVAASLYCPITQNLVQSTIVKKLPIDAPVWHRIVYEKPFGRDLQSAHEINTCIDSLLYEHQIYRVDHYLTKEFVNNIALLRFTNCIFEPLWNNRFIDNVQIILSEDSDIKERGAYYDAYGALCDVVQNHMLELMALIAMEAPARLTGEYIRDERAKVLQKMYPVDGVVAQYEGYRQEKAVAPQSKTETFAAVMLKINNPRWAGVPFYLKTGKALERKETVIHIKFKQVDCLLTKNCPSDSDCLTIRLYPEESFAITLNSKKPGTQELVPVSMRYTYASTPHETIATAHEALLEEIIRGEQSVSVRFDEIEYAWQVIDKIRALQLPLAFYQQKSKGPNEVEAFAKKHGIRWRS